MKKKTIALLLVMVMIFGISVGGTIAYLTDREAVTNTFTVGNVKIKLTETAVNEAGIPVNEAGQTDAEVDGQWEAATITANDSTPVGNQYKLIPGMSYDKDPMVTVLAKSEESYVRMIVKVSDMTKLTSAFPKEKYADYYNGDLFLLQKLVSWNEAQWPCVGYKNGEYEFRYFDTVKYSETDTNLVPLFEKINIPGSIDNAALANLNAIAIAVEAHAIQKAGFADADAAWDAWED